METLNSMLPENITKLDATLLPPSVSKHTHSTRSLVYQKISALLADLGEKSAKAQQLSRVITTADKIRFTNQIIYLLKDPKGDNGKGELIGYLKIGPKNLYLHDESERSWEQETLCVLDFFVLESHRRQGKGRLLFDFMLQDQEVKAHQLAIDGPSPKMEMFLKKNYDIQRLIRQRNNFAVAPDFFHDSQQSRSGRNSPQPPILRGRYASPRPACAIASIIHGDGENNNQRLSVNNVVRFPGPYVRPQNVPGAKNMHYSSNYPWAMDKSS